MKVFCVACGEEINIRPSYYAKGKGRFCSSRCANNPGLDAGINLGSLYKVLCEKFGILRIELLGNLPHKRISGARQVGMYLVRELGGSYEYAAWALNREDHTTALHAWRRIKKRCEADSAFADLVQSCKQQIEAKP